MNKFRFIINFIGQHKYAITFIIFLLIIGFLDENSLTKRIGHWKEIHELKSEIEHYKKQYEESNNKLKALTSTPEELEKIAREKYLMKEKDEDIYVFENSSEATKQESNDNEKSE